MKLYYYTIDGGDGSNSVGWCTEENLAALYEVMENDPETYGANEGSTSSITLPDDFDVSTLGLSKYRFFDPNDER
jgi:hypothetical protein